MNLSISEAKLFVKARMDELAQTNSDMLVDANDERNLGLTIEKLLPEAIVAVHLSAPASLLEGPIIDQDSTGIVTSLNNRVISIDFGAEAITDKINLLRLISFKCGDGIAISEEFPEDSPQGRMQQNEYVKGQPDEPVLIRKAGSSNYHPHYLYYSTDLGSTDLGFSLEYYPLPIPTFDNTSGETVFFISPSLKHNILNHLTAMVLATYGMNDKAKYFFERAAISK